MFYIFTYNNDMNIKDYKIVKSDLLTIYHNYLYSLQVREEYGNIYGDTDELISMYEEKLFKPKIKINKL